MNSSGQAGIPGLIPRGQQIINLQSGGTITLGRHGQPVALAGGHAGVVLSGNQNQAANPTVRRQGAPPPKCKHALQVDYNFKKLFKAQ